ncbi:MAG: alcohol dehydrogenase [Verrucomicrobia bacterium]|nr:MAG: alcohol dehydrogenase [Verrucomicrobiota bacterium]
MSVSWRSAGTCGRHSGQLASGTLKSIPYGIDRKAWQTGLSMPCRFRRRAQPRPVSSGGLSGGAGSATITENHRLMTTGKFLSTTIPRPPVSTGLGLVLVTALTLLPRLAAGDWPQWRGPGRNGHCAEPLPSRAFEPGGMRLAWEARVGTGFSSITVAGERAYTMGNEDDTDVVRCLDTATGRVLWEHRYASDLGPKYYEGGPGATPTVAGGQVFTISKWGHVFCLDAATGAVVWQRDLREEPGLKPNEWGYAGSALVDGDRVYFNASEAGLALDRRTGRVLWFHGKGTAGYASPILQEIAGRRVLWIFAAKRLVGLEPASGREVASFPWPTGYDNNNADPIPVGERVFITSYDRGCALLEAGSAGLKPVYANDALQTHMAPPVLVGGHLYGFSRHYARRPEFRCVEAATGRVRWRQTGVRAGSVTALADGRLLVLYGDGQLALVAADPAAHRELGRFRALEGRCWTPPTLAHGRLYVRQAKGLLRCYVVAD